MLKRSIAKIYNDYNRKVMLSNILPVELADIILIKYNDKHYTIMSNNITYTYTGRLTVKNFIMYNDERKEYDESKIKNIMSIINLITVIESVTGKCSFLTNRLTSL